MKNIIITGGAGFIGSVLVRHLLDTTDYNITVIDKLYFGYESIADIFKDFRIMLYDYDIRHIKNTRIFENADAVVHLAAISNDPSAEIDYNKTMGTNVGGTGAILELCKQYRINKFIFASSCSTYGYNDKTLNEESQLRPLSWYGLSKQYAEAVVKSYASYIDDIAILRFGTVFGYSKRFRTDLVVNTMVKSALTEGAIIVRGDGCQYRPHVNIKDVASVISELLKSDNKRCEAYNIVDFNMNIRNLASCVAGIINKVTGKFISIKFLRDIIDNRNYNVTGLKLFAEFGNLYKHSLQDAISEIIHADIKDLDNPMYRNAEWLKDKL